MTVRSRLNAAITHDLAIDFGFAGGLSFRRSPRCGNGGSASVCEYDKAFADAVRTPAVEFPADRLPGRGDRKHRLRRQPELHDKSYAALTENGFFTEKGRSGTVTASLTYDLIRCSRG